MTNTGHPLSLLMLAFATLVFVGMLAKAVLERVRLPSLVAFMVLGFMLRVIHAGFDVEITGGEEILHFLSYLGVTCLLFRVGLDSDVVSLAKRLRTASVVWAGNVLLSGGGGYLVGYYWLDLGVTASLFLGVALTATSVGVSVAAWQHRGALNTANGEVLLDVAELDDISGVVLMALLFAVAPVLTGGEAAVMPTVLTTLGWVVLKLAGFGALCVLYSRYAEERVTTFTRNLEHGPDPMLAMVTIALIIAAVAGLLGFSVAIGAFFAGLVFSRDPKAVRMEASFEPLYEFFTPFFFIHIGFLLTPDSLPGGLGVGLVLLLVAVLSKIVGTAVPAMVAVAPRAALLLGVSMLPRAEIAMIVMQRGVTFNGGGVPDSVYSGMVLVSAATCLATPLALRVLFRRWPETLR